MKAKVIKYVVDKNLCIGCGMCASVIKNKFLEMDWNEQGFLVATQKQGVLFGEEEDDAALAVCPFNPFPANEVKTEDEIANLFLSDASQYDKYLGRFTNTYAGFSYKYRSTSSSGGIATYLFEKLLENDIVDNIVVVRESGTDRHFEYQCFKNIDEIKSISKTRYYPVTLNTALNEIEKIEGRIAVVGVGCFIKALRLSQYHMEDFNDKIKFLIGIICGGVKSSFFAEYLASKAGIGSTEGFIKPEFRIKNENSVALDYSFGCINKVSREEHSVRMRTVGDMWGTGLFKSNACDLCEDVTTELADISLGDAWISPYSQEGKGTNIIVTRSALGEKLIQQGIASGELSLDLIDKSRVVQSQKSSFTHRQDALKYRLNVLKSQIEHLPPKRSRVMKNIPIYFRYVQRARMSVREQSLLLWRKYPDAVTFDKALAKYLRPLKQRTKFYHLLRNLKRRFKLK